jgi:hypothetical protein
MLSPLRISGIGALALLGAACSGQVDAGFIGPKGGGANLLPGEYAGHCDAAFPKVSLARWRHPFKSRFAVAQGGPNHRITDLVLLPGEDGVLEARFTYGIFDKDLEDEDVEVYVQTCPGWEFWGKLRTDDDGKLFIPVPGVLQPGDYKVRLVVKGDGTTADGELAVWREGVQAIVTDIDGTLTTNDFQLIEDVIFGAEADMFEGANEVIDTWVAKNYRIVYLTGRAEILNRYTRDWLVDHGFPRGVLRVTDSAGDVLPTDSGVRQFKADFLLGLEGEDGVRFTAAYGNASTDIGAYDDAGIFKADTYIIGPNAGDDSTQAVSSYPEHLPLLDTYPDAVQP